jgi:hypothetical protein
VARRVRKAIALEKIQHFHVAIEIGDVFARLPLCLCDRFIADGVSRQ